MSHIDEGQLHALLDGALEPVEVEALQQHAASCALCAALLEEERSVRERSNRILNEARPLTTSVPPFETILERARSPRQRTSIPGPARLAWAATIVLALGMGWLARDFAPRSAVRETASLDQAVKPEAVSPSAPSRPAAPPPAMAEPPTEPAPLRSSAPSLADVAKQQSQTGAAAGGVTAADVQAKVQPAARRSTEAADAAQKTVAANAAAESVRIRAPVAVVAAPPVQAAPQPLALQQIVQQRLDSASRAASSGGGGRGGVGRLAETRAVRAEESGPAVNRWEYLDLDRAEQRVGRKILVIPGLDLLSVGISPGGSGYMVRTTQRLPRDGMLEVQQQSFAITAGAAPRVVDGSDGAGGWVVTVFRNDLMLVGRSTLAPDSIRALLLRAR